MKLRFLCPVCNDVCIRTPTCTRNQTMMCKTHSRHLHYSKRPKYNGPIPLHIRRPVRAGLLLGVDRDQLCDVVASLEPVNKSENPVCLATSYIENIAHYDRVCLADNCFWGDDGTVRMNGVRALHKKPQNNKRGRLFSDADSIDNEGEQRDGETHEQRHRS